MSAAAPDKRELRAMVDSQLLEALDMIAYSKNGMARSDLVVIVLSRYVAAKQREASLIVKGPAVTPLPLDSSWSDLA